ncbi:LysR substrate-binding domain-containing protein [Cupriavidus necator]
MCILPQDHPLAGRAVLTPEDFAGTAWIGYPQGTPLGRAVARFFGERAVHCAPAIEYIPRSPRARSCSKGWVRRWWMRGA